MVERGHIITKVNGLNALFYFRFFILLFLKVFYISLSCLLSAG